MVELAIVQVFPSHIPKFGDFGCGFNLSEVFRVAVWWLIAGVLLRVDGVWLKRRLSSFCAASGLGRPTAASLSTFPSSLGRFSVGRGTGGWSK